jgi:hypothetical protein
LPGIAVVAGLLVLVVAIGALTAGVSALGGCAGTTAAGGSTPGGEIPAALEPDFLGAAARFGLGAAGWAMLAAINEVESDFDDTALPGVARGANGFGAAGPMQIGIGGAAGDTWSRVKVDGVPGGASPPSVYDEADAVYAAANLLRGSGAPQDWAAALFAYNHAAWYVKRVGALASSYASLGPLAASSGQPAASSGPLAAGAGCEAAVSEPLVAGSTAVLLPAGLAAIPLRAPAPVREMLAAGNLIIDEPYSYGGGHAPASMSVPPDPDADPGAEENGGPGYDCSSAVDYVLWGAGLGAGMLAGAVPASQGLARVGDPGPGRWVTIYAGSSGGQPHAFVAVDGLVLDTVHLEPTAPAGTGPRWQPQAEVARELAAGAFVARHPPGL